MRVMSQRTRARGNTLRSDWLFLALLAGVLGFLNLRAQWTGIATDPDFTAWVAPLSNRIAAGQRLYDFGGHMPLPPLPYVLLYWLSAGHATWLTESFWTQTLTMLSVLLLFWRFSDIVPRSAALVGAIAALATFSASQGVLFYCVLPNFLVVCLACVGVAYVRRASIGRSGLCIAGMSFLAAAAVLAKQNVGGLALVGAAALILATPATSAKTKLSHVVLFSVSSLLFLGLICIALSPWISLSGMMQDVFLTGSECKGGTGVIISKLLNYGFQMTGLLILAGFIAAALAGANLINVNGQTSVTKFESEFGTIVIGLLSLGGLTVGILLSRAQIDALPSLYATEQFGLAICLFALIALLLKTWRPNSLPRFLDNEALLALGVPTIILLPAALGYSVTTPIFEKTFYWYIGFIPLLQIALTAVAWLAFAGAEQLPAKSARWAAGAFVILFIAQNWQPWRVHWAEIKNCTDTWPGVEWFAHARVTQNARPLEALVADVRNLTQAGDTVLLLPDDPNLEECFDRPRPALNCAIVFTDQYWPRYVADDFARLQRDPPKVILIGPRDHWRDYSRLRNNTGAVESLIDRIQTQLLPARYQLAKSQPISYNGGTDYLDVWVRKD